MSLFKKEMLFVVLLFIQNIDAICIMIRVPNNFFKASEPLGRFLLDDQLVAISPSNFYDLRMNGVPREVLRKFLNKSNPTSLALDTIPDDILKKYSPFTVFIEYKRPSGRIVTVQQPIAEAGLIEKCYLSDEKIVEKKGVIQSIKETIGGKEVYKDLKISLRRQSGIYFDRETIAPCANYETFNNTGIEIQLTNGEQLKNPCSVMIIK